VNGLIVFVGGGVGAALRYWMTGSVYRVLGAAFPYGTLLVNVLGSVLIGFCVALFDERFVVQPALRLFLTIGVLGGFTTFSTFSYETIALLQEGSWWLGTLNILGSVLTCLAGCWIGGVLGRVV
jgi:fluoride exporter